MSSSTTPVTYFVSPNGDDNNPGTIAQPFKTLQQAVNRVGDGQGGTIYLREGLYQNASTFIGTEHDGSETSRLVIRPYENEKVIIESGFKDSAIGVAGSYVDVMNLEVRNSYIGIVGLDAQHLRIINNTVYDTFESGIASYANSLFGASDIWVEGNTVYRTNLRNQDRGETGGWGSGITMSRTRNAVVTKNLVYQNWGEGITSTLSDNVVVSKNTLYDNYSVQLYMDNASNTLFENNFVYDTGDTRFDRVFGSAAGITIANEDYNDSNPLRDNVIRNNVVVNSGVAFVYGSYGEGGGSKNVRVENNIFYGSEDQLIELGAEPHTGLVFTNNIFQATQGPISLPASILPPGVSFSSNLWSGPGFELYADPGDRQGDPKFVNPGGLSPTDYRLGATSAALVNGQISFGVNAHFFDVAFPGKPAPNPNPVPVPNPNPNPIPVPNPIPDPIAPPTPIVEPTPIAPEPTPPIVEPTPVPPQPKKLALQILKALNGIDLRRLDLNGDGRPDLSIPPTLNHFKHDLLKHPGIKAVAKDIKNIADFYQLTSQHQAVRDPLTNQPLNPGDTSYAAAAFKQKLVSKPGRSLATDHPIDLDIGSPATPFKSQDKTVTAISDFIRASDRHKPHVGPIADWRDLKSIHLGAIHKHGIDLQLGGAFKGGDRWPNPITRGHDLSFTVKIQPID